MKRIILMLTMAAMLAAALTVTAAPGFAAPPCPADSDTERATSTGEPGEFNCTTTTTSKKNPKFTKEDSTTTKGSSAPHEETTTACEPTGSGKCPPGQF